MAITLGINKDKKNGKLTNNDATALANTTAKAAIPTSNNLNDIAKQMSALGEFTNKVTPLIIDWSKTVTQFNKINTKELYKTSDNIKDISRSLNSFTVCMGTIIDELKKFNETISLDDINNLSKKLLTSEKEGQETTQKMIETKADGSSVDMSTVVKAANTKEPGLIDIIAQVATIGGIMTSIKFINPIKFKLKFKQTMRLFKWQYKKLVAFSSTFDADTIKTIKFATDGLQEVLMSLPTSVNTMADMFSKYGKPIKYMKIKLGIQAMLGENEDGESGIMGAMKTIGKSIDDIKIDSDAIVTFEKNMKKFDKTVRDITLTLTLVALAGPIMRLGAKVLFGHGKGKRGNGVIGLMITGLEWVANRTKDIKDASKALIYIATSILLLTGAVLLMALAGAIVITEWVSILAVMGFVGVLTLVFIGIGLASRWIEKGGRELLYIAAVVGILALIAVVLVLTGQFVKVNWAFIGIVALMLVILVGAFILIGLASRWIEKGGKELLYIALTVGILALIAIALVFVGQYLEANWESILAIGLMLTLLSGMLMAIGYAAKHAKDNVKGMLMLVAFVVVLSLMALVLAYVAENHDMLNILFVTGILMGVVTFMLKIIKKVAKQARRIQLSIPAIAALVGATLLLSLVMINLATAANMADPLEILAVAGIMTAIVLAVGGIVLAASIFIGGVQAIAFELGMIALAQLSVVGLLLSSVVVAMAGAKKAIDDLGVTSVKELIDTLTLPIKAFTGDDDKPGLFEYIKDLPGTMDMLKYTAKVKCLSSMIGSIGDMADVLQHVASLNMPDTDKGFDEHGKPKGYRQMTANDFMAAANNAGVILGMTLAMFSTTAGDKGTKFKLEGKNAGSFTIKPVDLSGIYNINVFVKRSIKRLATIVGYVGNMADVLQKIASLSIPDSTKGYTDDGRPKAYRQMLPEDFVNASNNASTIINTLAGIFAGEPVEVMVNNKKIILFRQVSQTLNGLENISRRTRNRVERLGTIVGVVGGMADTIQKLAGLIVPKAGTTFDENGKPKEYTIMGPDDFVNASTNIGKIMSTIITAMYDEGLFMKLNNIRKRSAKKFQMIMEPISSISNIVEVIKLLAGGEYVTKWEDDPDNPGQRRPAAYASFRDFIEGDGFNKMQDNIAAIFMSVIGGVVKCVSDPVYKNTLKVAAGITSELDEIVNKVHPLVDDIMSIYDEHISGLDVVKFEKNMQAPIDVMLTMIDKISATTSGRISLKNLNALRVNITETKGLMKQINSTNIDKLKTARDLMDRIASISKDIRGDFKGLAEVINEDLVDALEKLQDTLESFGNRQIFAPTTSTEPKSNPGNMLPSTGSGTENAKNKLKGNDKQNQIQNQKPPQIDYESILTELKAINTLLTNAKNATTNAFKVEMAGR